MRIRVRNYKCFGSDQTIIDDLAPINIIVGRNNSGKSALIDVIDVACTYKGIPDSLRHLGQPSEIEICVPLPQGELQRIFQANTSGGNLPGNHWEFGKQFVDKVGVFRVTDSLAFMEVEGSILPQEQLQYFRQLKNPNLNPLFGKKFRRLVADRDIAPEGDDGSLTIAPNGRGFTNAVQRYITKSFLPSTIIETEMLAGLNEIFGTDARFLDIAVQHHESGLWEVFLREEHKGLISLSNSGSGLKTVLLVLGFFICLPHIENVALSEFVFAFEELENNLHPALQRRLVEYIRKKCVEKKCIAILTTHSSAVIDFLGHNKDTQIFHVSHTGATATVRHVTTYVENRGVLDDLDVRASDLLQANGIVWVEGPSDRLYLNRWLDLLTQGKLREGAHYQCVFYGGRLLAHLSGEAPFDEVDQDQAVKILAVNRNAIVVIDSDRHLVDDGINDTKRRIIASMDELGGVHWVTHGKEIENYISRDALLRVYPGIGELGEYDDIGHFLDQHEQGLGIKFRRNKVLFAESVLQGTLRSDLDVSDLSSKLREIANRIASWNGMAVTW
jgi:hypothetical protein